MRGHSTFLIASFCFVTFLVHDIEPASSQQVDLSLLSSQDKENGVGQLQVNRPKSSDPQPEEPSSRPTPRQQTRMNNWQANHWHGNTHSQNRGTQAGLGIGAATSGLVMNGVTPSRNDSPFYPNDTLPSQPTIENEPSSLSGYSNLQSTDSPILQRQSRLPLFAVSANAIYVRDINRFSAPINDDVYSSRLGWSGATGFDTELEALPPEEGSIGFQIGSIFVSGSDQITSGPVNFLYTTPDVGFSSHPMQSNRDMALQTYDANLLVRDATFQKVAIGIRYLHVDDTLTNEVLPNGVFHRIDTNSNSLLLQVAVHPRIELNRVHFESKFQIGAGAFWADASTDLNRFVSPVPIPSHVETNRVTGAAFLNTKAGIAIPIGTVGVLRSGLQLFAQNDMAQAAAQISHTDFLKREFHLRTESLALGALYLGLELHR